MRSLLAVAITACFGLSPLHAAESARISAAAVATAAQLRERAQNDPTAYAFVADLTTQIGPRLAGSDNDQRARDWTIARFKALGFDKVWTEPVTFPKWVRRSESAQILTPYAQHLAVSALGSSPATPKGGLS